MGKQKFCTIALSSIFIFLFVFAIRAEALDFSQARIPIPDEKVTERFQNLIQKLCAIRVKIHEKFPRFPVPKICKTQNIKPPVLEFYAEPTSITEGDKATLSWASDNTLSCEASGGWSGEKTLSGNEEVSPTENTAYNLSCDGVKEGIEKSVTVEVTPLLPPPPTDVCPNIDGVQENVPAGYHKEGNDCILDTPPTPTLDHIIISEVYYDVASDKGNTSGNEWIEIYNGTGGDVDISGWVIADVSSEFDLIPLGTIIPNLSFMVLTASSTTSGFWGGAPMVSLNTARLGNNLGNDGDTIYLKNSASTTVDAMSYGTITPEVFTPAAPDVDKGHSLKKNTLTTNNGATYWDDLTTPNPGSF